MWIVIQRKIIITETAEYDNYDHACDLLMFTCVIDCKPVLICVCASACTCDHMRLMVKTDYLSVFIYLFMPAPSDKIIWDLETTILNNLTFHK